MSRLGTPHPCMVRVAEASDILRDGIKPTETERPSMGTSDIAGTLPVASCGGTGPDNMGTIGLTLST